MKANRIQRYLIRENLLPVFYLIILSSIITLTSESLILSSLVSAGLIGVKLIPLPFEIDSNEKLDKFYKILPISPKDYVFSRYIFLLLLGIIGIGITLGIKSIIFLIWKNHFYKPHVFIEALIIGLVFYMLILTIQLPMYYKYGSIKAKLFSLIPILLILCIFSFFSYEEVFSSLTRMLPFVKNKVLASQGIALIISILLMRISYYNSIKIIKAKG